MKTDDQGVVLWTKTYAIGSYSSCLQQTTDGGFVLVGMIVTDDQPDIYLVKTNSSGDTLWTKTIGTSDSLEFARAVRQLPDGYIIAGHVGPMPLAGVDGLLVKTDLSGDVMWKRSYGDSLSDVCNSVEIAPDGGFIVSGNTNCMWHVHVGNMWVFKTDPAGNLLWERKYDIALSDYIWSCVKTSDEGYVVTGMLGYTIGGDLWLAKIGPETGNQENQQHTVPHHMIENHPNPFTRSTMISYLVPQSGRVSLEIYDIAGRRICTLVNRFHEKGAHSISFDAATLASGVYFCKLRVGEDVVSTYRMIAVR
jgi:hypothetical protein